MSIITKDEKNGEIRQTHHFLNKTPPTQTPLANRKLIRSFSSHGHQAMANQIIKPPQGSSDNNRKLKKVRSTSSGVKILNSQKMLSNIFFLRKIGKSPLAKIMKRSTEEFDSAGSKSWKRVPIVSKTSFGSNNSKRQNSEYEKTPLNIRRVYNYESSVSPVQVIRSPIPYRSTHYDLSVSTRTLEKESSQQKENNFRNYSTFNSKANQDDLNDVRRNFGEEKGPFTPSGNLNSNPIQTNLFNTPISKRNYETNFGASEQYQRQDTRFSSHQLPQISRTEPKIEKVGQERFDIKNFLSNRDSEKLHIKIQDLEKITVTSNGQYLLMGGRGLHVLDMSGENFKLVRYDKRESKQILFKKEIKFNSIKILENNNILVSEPVTNDLIIYDHNFEEIQRIKGIKGDCFGKSLKFNSKITKL